MPDAKRPLWLVCAPGAFILLWASGFPVIKWGVVDAEPFTMLAVRSAANVLIALSFALIMGSAWPRNLREAIHIVVAGILLQTAYLGCMFNALAEGVPSGAAALIAGLQPVLTAAVVGPLLGERVSRSQWLGFLLGFAGVGLVVSERLTVGSGTLLGWIVIAVAPFMITAGSLYQKRYCADMGLATGMVIQHSAAFVTQYVLALAFETRDISWTFQFVFVIGWFVLALSVGANNLYYVLLRRGEAARVSGMFFLTPPAAVVIGYFALGETFGLAGLAGFVVAGAGVWLVTRHGRADTVSP